MHGAKRRAALDSPARGALWKRQTSATQEAKPMKNVPWQIEKIINVANELASTGSSGGSTGEVIAAAFVLDRMEFIPHGYTIIEAWERLDEQ